MEETLRLSENPQLMDDAPECWTSMMRACEEKFEESLSCQRRIEYEHSWDTPIDKQELLDCAKTMEDLQDCVKIHNCPDEYRSLVQGKVGAKYELRVCNQRALADCSAQLFAVAKKHQEEKIKNEKKK